MIGEMWAETGRNEYVKNKKATKHATPFVFNGLIFRRVFCTCATAAFFYIDKIRKDYYLGILRWEQLFCIPQKCNIFETFGSHTVALCITEERTREMMRGNNDDNNEFNDRTQNMH